MLLLLSVVSMAADCNGPTENEEEEKLSGVWDYQRDTNGGWSQGGQTVWWLLEFESEPGRVHFYAGKIYEDDPDFGITPVWQYSGSGIDAQYELSGNSVTFIFDDLMNPRRTSFGGQLVSSSRIQGDGWFTELCDVVDRNCGG
jgi:hypothetical protein